MRRALVLIGVAIALVLMGVGLWALLAPPTAMAAALPRTVEEQAERIGDLWAAWLIEDCGEALPLETIAGPQEELVEGLKGLFEQALTLQEFSVVEGCMMSGVDGYTPRHPPHELELRRDVRTNLYNLDYYLANPPPDTGEAHRLSEDPYAQVQQQVGFQVAELFYLLQRDLIAELAPSTEDPEAAAKTIAGAVFVNGQALVVLNLYRPRSGVFKRPLTEEEMEGLRAAAWEIVQASARSFEQGLGPSPEFGQANQLKHEAGPAASLLATMIQRIYWDERPPMLSAEEQRTLDEALATRYSAEEPILSEELTLFDEWFRVWDEAEPAP